MNITHKAVYEYWLDELGRVAESGVNTLEFTNYPWCSFALDCGEVTCFACGSYSGDADELLTDDEIRKNHYWKAWMRSKSGLTKRKIIRNAEEYGPGYYAFLCSDCCLAPQPDTREILCLGGRNEN